MAFTHSQATATNVVSGSSTSISGVLTNNPASGDVVCAGVLWFNGSGAPASMSVADLNSNAYTKGANSPSSAQAAGAGASFAFRLIAGGTASKTVTATYSNPGASGATAINVDDFAVAGGSASFDLDVAGSGATGTTINTPTVTRSGTNELLWGYAGSQNGISAAGSPWTLGGIDAGGNASEYILSSSANQALAFTQTSGVWDSVGMSFSISSGFTPAWGVRSTHTVLGGVQ